MITASAEKERYLENHPRADPRCSSVRVDARWRVVSDEARCSDVISDERCGPLVRVEARCSVVRIDVIGPTRRMSRTAFALKDPRCVPKRSAPAEKPPRIVARATASAVNDPTWRDRIRASAVKVAVLGERISAAVLNPPVRVALIAALAVIEAAILFTMKASAAKAETLTDTMDASAVSVANRASRTRAEAENVLEADRRMTALAVIDPSGWDEIHARAEKPPTPVVLVIASEVSDPDPTVAEIAFAVNERCWPRSTMALVVRLPEALRRRTASTPTAVDVERLTTAAATKEPEPLDDRRTALPVTELLLVPEIRAVAEKALARLTETIALAEKVPDRATRRTADPVKDPGIAR